MKSSTLNFCCPANFLTSTDTKAAFWSVSENAASSAVTATVGATVIFGISNVIPASGNVPRLIASIDGRMVVDSPLITSAS